MNYIWISYPKESCDSHIALSQKRKEKIDIAFKRIIVVEWAEEVKMNVYKQWIPVFIQLNIKYV